MIDASGLSELRHFASTSGMAESKQDFAHDSLRKSTVYSDIMSEGIPSISHSEYADDRNSTDDNTSVKSVVHDLKKHKQRKRSKSRHSHRDDDVVRIPKVEWEEFKEQNKRILNLLNDKPAKKAKRDLEIEIETDDDLDDHFDENRNENQRDADAGQHRPDNNHNHDLPANAQNNNNDGQAQDDFDFDAEVDGLIRERNNEQANDADQLNDLQQEYADDDELGQNVHDTLASLITRMHSRMPDNTQRRICDAYKIPRNCNKICVPKVNNELWTELNRDVKTTDLKLQRVQRNMVKTAAIMIDSAATLPDAQIRGVLDGLGMTLKNLRDVSVDRRILITNSLHYKYRKLASNDIPVTEWLFGNDFSTLIKNIEANSKLGRNVLKSNRGRKFLPSAAPKNGEGSFGTRYARKLQQFQYQRRMPTFRGRGRGRGMIPRQQTTAQNKA